MLEASGHRRGRRRQHRGAAGRRARRPCRRAVRGRGVVVPPGGHAGRFTPRGRHLAELRARPPRRAPLARRPTRRPRPASGRDQAPDEVAVANADDPVVAAHAAGVPRPARHLRPRRPTADWHVAGGRLRRAGRARPARRRRAAPRASTTTSPTPWPRRPRPAPRGRAPTACAATLRAWPRLPHRVQLVGRRPDGVRFYDDSKATTPHAVARRAGGLRLGGADRRRPEQGPRPRRPGRGRRARAGGRGHRRRRAPRWPPRSTACARWCDGRLHGRGGGAGRRPGPPGRRRAAVAGRAPASTGTAATASGATTSPGRSRPDSEGATDERRAQPSPNIGRARRRASAAAPIRSGPARWRALQARRRGRRPPRPAGRPGQGGIEGVERPVATPPSTACVPPPARRACRWRPADPTGRPQRPVVRPVATSRRSRAERRAVRAARRASRAARRASRTARRDARRRLVRGAAPPRSRRGWTRVSGRPTATFLGLLGVVVTLNLIGLVMVLSASSVTAQAEHGSPWYYVQRQALWSVVGRGRPARRAAGRLPALAGAGRARPARVRSGCSPWCWCPGSASAPTGPPAGWAGARSASSPSELAKLALLLFVADLLGRRLHRMHDTRRHAAAGAGGDPAGGGADHGAAQPRHHDRARRHRHRPAVRGGGAPGAAWPAGPALGSGAGHRGGVRRPLPPGPPVRLPRPLVRPDEHRLPDDPGAGRRWPRAGSSGVGRRRGPGEVGLPALRPHRLHLRGDRRGVRPGRRDRRDRPVRAARRARRAHRRCGPPTASACSWRRASRPGSWSRRS